MSGLAADFRHFALAAAPASPLYAVLSERIAEDAALLALAGHAPPENRPPNLFFAAIQHCLTRQPSDPLARYYANLQSAPLPPNGAFPDFRRFALAHAGEIARLVGTRRTSTNEIQRAAVLLPAFALAADAGEPPHLIEVGCSAGLLLSFDRLAYDYGAAGRLEQPGAALTLACRAEGPLPLPARIPPVASRIGLDLAPLDAGNAEDAAWLEALVWPEQSARRARLRQALALTRETKPRLLAGDAAETFARVAAALPPGEALLVFHSFALVQFPPPAKARLLAALEAEAARRPLWRVGYEHVPTAAHAVLTLCGKGEERLLAEASPHGDWVRWV